MEPTEDNHQHPPVLENRAPESLASVFYAGWSFLEQYGWYLLLAVIVLYYLWNKFRPGLERWRRQQEDAAFYGKYSAEQLQQREEALRRARDRMQAELNAKAEPFMEEQRRKEEEKRKAKIDNWERHQEGKGYRSKYRPPEDDNNSAGPGEPGSSDGQPKPRKRTQHRPDYNPLMGDSSGFSYRPPRSSSGGG